MHNLGNEDIAKAEESNNTSSRRGVEKLERKENQQMKMMSII